VIYELGAARRRCCTIAAGDGWLASLFEQHGVVGIGSVKAGAVFAVRSLEETSNFNHEARDAAERAIVPVTRLNIGEFAVLLTEHR